MIWGIVTFPVSKEEVPKCQKGCLQIIAHLTQGQVCCCYHLTFVICL